MFFRQIFDPKLAQYAYLIGCQQTGEAIVIDPQRDVDRYLKLAQSEGLKIIAATETHIHADFLSGVRELCEQHDAAAFLSDEGGRDWRYEWPDKTPGTVVLLKDGDRFHVGNIEFQVLFTPGHTPEHVSFLVFDHGGGASEPMGIATGDFVFVGALGRPDLLETAAGEIGAMEPAAESLYDSVALFRRLRDYLQVWPGHGAGSACGKALGAVPMSTVGYEKKFSPALEIASRGKEVFVASILDGQPEPPLYFARMKQLNRMGPAVLGSLPKPKPLTFDDLATLERPVILDTRSDRTAFMAGHLPGALFAPLNKSFPTIAGSYVSGEETIVLVVSEERVDEAIRDLVRIGLDRVVGYITEEQLASYPQLLTTPVGDFSQLSELLSEGPDEVLVLDVRGAAEHAARCVPGSRNVAHTRLRAHLSELPKERRLLVHCLSGARAASAASLLEREGFGLLYIDDAIGHFSA